MAEKSATVVICEMPEEMKNEALSKVLNYKATRRPSLRLISMTLKKRYLKILSATLIKSTFLTGIVLLVFAYDQFFRKELLLLRLIWNKKLYLFLCRTDCSATLQALNAGWYYKRSKLTIALYQYSFSDCMLNLPNCSIPFPEVCMNMLNTFHYSYSV